MSQYHGGAITDITFVAEADLSSLQYHIVKFGTAAHGLVAATSAAGICGILQNAPKSGEQATVRIAGPSKCYLDGTTDIAAGDGIVADAASHGVKNTADKGRIVGWALEPQTTNAAILTEVMVAVQTQSV
jgi:hypothetical protein